MVYALMILGVLSFLNACAVAEGPAFLRIEGSVVDQEHQPVVGQEIQVQVEPRYSSHRGRNSKDEAGKALQTDTNGKFSVEKSQFSGGMLIIPMALLVAPFSGLIAAVTPWEYWDVQEFFSPAYLVGSYCLPHPVEINVSVGSLTSAVAFPQQEIKDRLYQGKDRTHRKSCTRVYNLGELKVLPSQMPK